MARATPIITSTNAGELSPTLDGRVDLSKYPQGCKRLENFLSMIQGPSVRRGGTRFVAEIKNSANHAWLIKFEFSATQCFYIEFGDSYCRWFTNHGQLVVSGVAAYNGATTYAVGDLVVQGGVNYYCIAATTGNAPPNVAYWYPLTGAIYEIPSPYPLAALTNADGSCALQVEQSGDVLYIANQYRTYAPRKLTRFGSTKWVFATYAPLDGPFLELNSGSTALIASGQSGAVTFTASLALFAATDVGRLIRIEPDSFTTKPWEPGKAYALNDLVRSDGKTYKAMGAATSGTSPPVHEHGAAYDGFTGVQWAYQNAGYGVAKIYAFTDSTHVDATVVDNKDLGLVTIPIECTVLSMVRWNLGAWSATTEYPGAVSFYLSRLFWAGKQRLWGSVPDDFESMAPDFLGEQRADNAIARILASRELNDILWLAGADRLLVGTAGGEFAAGPLSTADPMGPANFEALQQSTHRVRAVRPVAVGTSQVAVQRSGRKLLSIDYAIQYDRYTSSDLAVLAERITRPGIIWTAYQGEPHSIVWAGLSSGALRAFTYEQQQEVQGWGRHPIGGNGLVESGAAGPAPDGSREELWLIVKRTINGVTRRYVEFMERPWEGDDDDGTPGDDQEDAFYVDCGLTYDGVPVMTFSGLGHLEGQTVEVLADGAVQPNKVVTGGAISLSLLSSVVHVGLAFVSRLVPMRIEAGSQTGTSQGKTKRIDTLTLRVLDSLGGKLGQYGKKLDSLSARYPSTPMGGPPPFHSGDLHVPYPGDYETDGLIEIVQDQPLPFTVVAIIPNLKTQDT